MRRPADFVFGILIYSVFPRADNGNASAGFVNGWIWGRIQGRRSWVVCGWIVAGPTCGLCWESILIRMQKCLNLFF